MELSMKTIVIAVTDNQKRLRINVSVQPRNVSGPAISIRKHPKKSYIRRIAKRRNV